MARSPSRTPDRGRGRPVQHRRSGWLIPVCVGVLLVAGLGIWFWLRGGDAAGTGSARPIAQLETQDYHALVWSPTEPNTAFFGHHGGLEKSTDGGRTWQPTALTNVDAMSLAASPKAPQRIYAAGHGVFRRSDDGGVTWTAPETAIQGADIHGFAQNPSEPDRLYAVVVGQGLRTSTDGGTSWTAIGTVPQGQAITVSADGKTLLMGTQAGVQQSSDNGTTWTDAGPGLPQDA